MKKTLVILLAAAILLPGCSPERAGRDNGGADKDFIIVTSFYPIYIFASNVARDVPGVKVFCLTGGDVGCLHDYQMLPDDMKALSRADLFLINGGGMESFLDKVTETLPALSVVDTSVGIEFIKNAAGAETELNAHVWASPSGAAAQTRNAAEGMAKADPAHAAKYAANAELYIARLSAMESVCRERLRPYRGADIVTFHEAFAYFARDFELNIAAVIEREPGVSPSAAELAETIGIIREKKVKAVFIEPQYPPEAANAIQIDTRVGVYTLDPVVTGALDALDAYETIMTKNIETLETALGAVQPIRRR